jgi:hypothetical protein
MSTTSVVTISPEMAAIIADALTVADNIVRRDRRNIRMRLDTNRATVSRNEADALTLDMARAAIARDETMHDNASALLDLYGDAARLMNDIRGSVTYTDAIRGEMENR